MASLPAELDFLADKAATPERMNRAMVFIALKIRALESQQPEFAAAVDALLRIGLDRVAETLVPAFNQATEIIDDLTAIRAEWESIDFADQVAALVLLETYSRGEADDLFALIAHVHTIANVTGLQAALDALTAAAAAKIPATEKGAANGVATLDAGAKIPAILLPSYVDDVVEAANFAALPGPGETSKIYVTLDDNKSFRWSGSAYVEISPSPGTTDAVPEGAGNKYFTEARVRAALATGLADTAGTPAAGDSILTIFGKVKKALYTDIDSTIRATVATGLADTAGTPAAGDSILTILGKVKKALYTDIAGTVRGTVATGLTDTAGTPAAGDSILTILGKIKNALFNGQIAFPAAQNASADPNTLDDYEEGTFTPALKFGGNNVGMVLGGNVSGRYTKIGRMVHLDIFLAITTMGSSTGTATVTGIPFTPLAAVPPSPGIVQPSGLVTVACPKCRLFNSTSIDLFDFTGSTTVVLTHADFQVGSDLQIQMHYMV